MDLTQIPFDVLLTSLEQMPLPNLLKLCSSDKYFRTLCQDERLWKRRTELEFGNKTKPVNSTWKEYYLSFINRKVPIYYQGDVVGNTIIYSDNKEYTLKSLIDLLKQISPYPNKDIYGRELSRYQFGRFLPSQDIHYAVLLDDRITAQNKPPPEYSWYRKGYENIKLVAKINFNDFSVDTIDEDLSHVTKILLVNTDKNSQLLLSKDLTAYLKNSSPDQYRDDFKDIINNDLLSAQSKTPIYVEYAMNHNAIIVKLGTIEKTSTGKKLLSLPIIFQSGYHCERLARYEYDILFEFLFDEKAPNNYSKSFFCENIIDYLKMIGHYHNL